MERIYSLNDLKAIKQNFSVTIGNFDGVHLGHQKMLKEIMESSKRHGLSVIVVTFRPHPIQILRPRENFLINSYDEKRELLEDIGIDYIYEISFTRDFSTLLPGEFLEKYIITKNLKKVFLGYDFVFGANKKGDSEFVRSFCEKKGLEFNVMDEFTSGEEKFSSSSIRESLKTGSVEKAASLLGRNFYVTGSVVKGAGRGKTIGFPTANIAYDEARIIPQRGVYITKTTYKDQAYHSVTNIGLNPTFSEREDLSVETHLLDFNSDIYGDKLRVQFVKRLRDEQKFSSVNELINKISNDVKDTREYFKKCLT